jgi:hypothetical protein
VIILIFYLLSNTAFYFIVLYVVSISIFFNVAGKSFELLTYVSDFDFEMGIKLVERGLRFSSILLTKVLLIRLTSILRMLRMITNFYYIIVSFRNRYNNSFSNCLY